MEHTGALLTVDDVATRLGVHARTVRRYLREGTLKGVRIGRQYRIASADLAALTGQPVTAPEAPVRLTRHAEASAVVQIDAIPPSEAMRIANGVVAAAKGHGHQTATPTRVETVYDEERARLKIIFTGDLSTASGLMQMLELYMP